MPRLMQWPLLLAVALLVCLVNLGCGSGGHPAAGSAADGGSATGSGSAPGGSGAAGGGNAPGTPGSNGSDGAPGAPGTNGQNNGGGGPTAPGSPITIPNIVKLYGQLVENAMNSLKYGIPLPGEGNAYEGIIAQCGGTLCVKLKTKVDLNKQWLSRCLASGDTEPPRDSVVPRGSTIWVLTGGQPCAPWETSHPSSPSPGGGQSSTSPSDSQSSTSPSDSQSSTSPSDSQSSTSPSDGQSPVDTSSP
jgi:hypothetical protein